MDAHPSMLYRAFRSKWETYVPRVATWRPPGHVPYVVDNLWEWVRPEECPTRRTAAFASPSSAEAKADGRIFVYRLSLPAGSTVAQLNGLVDSKLHTEVDRLRDLIKKALDPAWFSKELTNKGSEASLFRPCLHAKEVDSIVSGSKILSGIGLREQIRYWSDIRLIALGEEALAEVVPVVRTVFVFS